MAPPVLGGVLQPDEQTVKIKVSVVRARASNRARVRESNITVPITATGLRG